MEETLQRIAAAMRGAQDAWWIIGSAAVALHGGQPIAVRDVDVLMSAADVRRIVPGLGVALTPGVPDDRFHSELFCTWHAPPLSVAFMGGFHIRGEALVPATREAIRGVFVPARGELLAMLERFGRPKDLERARLLNPS